MNRDLGEMTEKSSHVDHIEIKMAGEVTERLSHEEDSQQESTSAEKDPEKAGKEKGDEDVKGSGNGQLRDSWRRKSLLMKRSRKVGFGSSARRDTPPQLDV